MKIVNLSDIDLKSVCGGLDITIVKAPKSPSIPDAAVGGLTTALTSVTGFGTGMVSPGDHGIANISSPLDAYVSGVGLPVAGSQSGQF